MSTGPQPKQAAVAPGRLDGRVALVTGAGRGIGRAIALVLADAGARVIVNYRRDGDAAAEVVATIEARAGTAHAVAAPVDDPNALVMLASAAKERFGDVDLLVHNAGVASRGLSVADTGREEVDRLLATHAVAAHHLTSLLLPGMRRSRRSDVVVISSSELGHMRAGGAPYNMAKAALEGFALTLAKEEAKNGLRVNIVAPGLVVTEMGDRLVRAKLGLGSAGDLDASQPFGRVVRPDDVAKVVHFLVSDAAAMLTGQRIVVDGGSDVLSTG